MDETNAIPNVSRVSLYRLDPMVGIEQPDVYERVLASVRREGIRYPLIVVKMTKSQWEDDTNPDILPPPGSLAIYYRIQCGNNRYRAAMELGYDSVDCIVVKSIEEAEQMCLAQRRGDKTW